MIKISNNLIKLANPDPRIEQYDKWMGRMPYIGAGVGSGLGALGGASIGALIQALRGKSVMKGLGYGGLAGLLGGAGLGTWRGTSVRDKNMSPEVRDAFIAALTNE